MTDASPAAASPNVAVLLVAAGRGSRAAKAGEPVKQFRRIAGEMVLTRSIRAFLNHRDIRSVQVVIHPDDIALYDEAVAAIDDARLCPPVFGGADRQQSALRGLEALETRAPSRVLIHDAVRPFISRAGIDAVLAALDSHPAVISGIPVVDTLKRCDDADFVASTMSREGVFRATTPQGFDYVKILAAHRHLAAQGTSGLTDDAAVIEAIGERVRMVTGDSDNMKLTTEADFAAAEKRLLSEAYLATPDVRVGTGYDVHVLEPGDGVTLCGIFIPHDQKLKGHSDADVALHALTDAILGALGDGDIGKHFPPSDNRWRGAASTLFLADAVRRLKDRGGLLSHCDISIIAEAPKVGPHREAMRARIAETCGITIDRVGVKATTNEGLGFAGRREGIAAIATATIRLPL